MSLVTSVQNKGHSSEFKYDQNLNNIGIVLQKQSSIDLKNLDMLGHF